MHGDLYGMTLGLTRRRGDAEGWEAYSRHKSMRTYLAHRNFVADIYDIYFARGIEWPRKMNTDWVCG